MENSKKRVLAKVFGVNMVGGEGGGVIGIRESADEQRCLEGVYTARKSER